MNTLPELLWQIETRYAESPALAAAGEPRENAISYAQLSVYTRRAAAGLHAKKLTPGERVLLYCEAGPTWPVGFFSILTAGLVAVPLPVETPLPIAARIASFAEARAAIVSPRTQGLADLAAGVDCFSVEQLMHSKKLADNGLARPGLAMLAFTSGSTSQPRAVELTHENLLADLESLLQVRQVTPGDAFLSMLPPAHLFELMVGLLGPLACGARIVYAGTLLPHRLIAALRNEGITHALSVPALLDSLYTEVVDELVDAEIVQPSRRGQSLGETARLLQQGWEPGELERVRASFRGRIGGTLHTVVVGGAALDPAWVDIGAPFGLHIDVGYGLTEASPVVSLGAAAECPTGSVGRPLPGIAVRVDENQEILVRGSNVMPGYFKNPDASAAAFQDGWLRTGDRGRVDENGFLFITGRLKEAMVTAAGETIYPEEIEPHYVSPLFAEWCIAALPGPQGNDLPALFVVTTSAELGEEELRREFERLRAAAPARFRVERMVRRTAALPRTSTGKVRRRDLSIMRSQGR